MNVRTNAILTFNSHRGEVVRLNIPRADMTLTPERAQAAMEAIISGGAVLANGGRPISILGAELVTTSRSPLVNA